VEWPAAPPGRAEREEARRRFGLGPRVRLCLFIAHGGVQAAYKAGDHWRALWRSIQTEIQDGVAFFIGGDTTEQPEPGLFCWPYLEQEQLTAAFLAADLFVYPTLADNHPLLVLEAMAWGCPTLAFAVGGVPEQITDRRNGRLVRPGDAPALLAVAVELLKDRRQARLLAEQAFAHGRERFDASRMAADYEGAYAQLQRQRCHAPQGK
jgi:glycosyltransferase involved in cell wall biosynthesis